MAVVEADLTVEDGTGLAAANVYVGLAVATEYHRLRGNDLWAEADEHSQCVALIRATQYLDTRWVWRNVVLEELQALEFPRAELYDRDGYDVSESVPSEIVHATCEYALAVLGDGDALAELSPTPDQTNGLSVTLQRDKVGDLETETRYNTGTGARVTKSYPKADRIVTRSGYTLYRGGGSTIR